MGKGGLIYTISTVGVDGLEEAENNPDIHRQNVEISRIPAVQQRSRQGPCTQNEGLHRVGILSRKTEWCSILMVQFMNMLVENTGVEHLVGCKRKKKIRNMKDDSRIDN